ncbi:MAG: HEAT repeat domain-containing protein, partial [bacterium]|nr:HEAT repeat domain-containing protein [bacterium]
GLKKYKKVILDSAKEKDNFEIKLAALDSLLNMENEKAFPILEKIVRKNKNAEMRKKALFILSQHNHSRVIPLLVEAALKDKNEENRKSAVFWLGQMDRPDSNRELLKLYNTVGMDLKNSILFAISQCSGKKAVKQLIRLYEQEKNLDLRKQIIFALGTNDSKEAREFILKLLE